MTSRNEPAGVWVRVSSGGQDEANQVLDIEKHCAVHGYTVAKRYELNDKRASIGEQEDKLIEMLHDMRDGVITVLVCWHSDRLERRGPEYVFRLLAQVRDAGGRIESIKEPLFGATDTSGEAMTALGAVISHQFSVHLGEQIRLAHDRIKANGAVGPGGTPWGFKVVGPKYNKQLIPTDLCRTYAPQIFQRAIDGESYRAIADWLDAEGVPPKRGGNWYEGSVRKLIHNRVYAGHWMSEDGKTTRTRCEEVVSAAIWERAQRAIKRQSNRKPADKSLLANLRCVRCDDSPMNRLGIKERHGRFTYWYYRCAGRGARRKGCGNMVRCDLAEQIVHAIITLISDEPDQTREWAVGKDYTSEISDARLDMHEAVDAGEFHKLSELQARIEELQDKQEHAEKGHWEYRDSGMTVGEYFHGLDYAGQREYLMSHDIRVGNAPKLDDLPGVHLVIDGEDYGVIRMARFSSSSTRPITSSTDRGSG